MIAVNSTETINVKKAPQRSAREILHKLWDHLGHPPSENFFPINLEEITKSILGWQIEEVNSIGQAQYGDIFSGEVIIGKIDVNKKLITLNIDDTSESERKYTLAHEIGHLVLHKELVSCLGGSALRKRSVRRLKFAHNNTANRKVEREADIFAFELLMPEKAVRKHFIDIFEREGIRSLSSFVRNLQDDNMSEFSRAKVDQSTPLSVSRYLATYKPAQHVKSLSEFFGVSIETMSYRLVELELVY